MTPRCVGCGEPQDAWVVPPEGADVWPVGTVFDGTCPACGARNAFTSRRPLMAPSVLYPGELFRPPFEWHETHAG